AKIELEGWTKDIQDAGFEPKFRVTDKNPTTQQTQPPQQQTQSPKEGTKQSSDASQNKITFKVSSLKQFTEYNNITLTLPGKSSGGGGGAGGSGGTGQSISTQDLLAQDLSITFVSKHAT
ncbi:hypothetical protein, partial [Mesomycoplasma ovipneumoniae]|uniref:hypothetical protein n=1 Tax=Mesomycoplasma ovipneumoniae TaxID=29562 RepID=UPI00307FFD34